jgi:hypothetical protein
MKKVIICAMIGEDAPPAPSDNPAVEAAYQIIQAGSAFPEIAESDSYKEAVALVNKMGGFNGMSAENQGEQGGGQQQSSQSSAASDAAANTAAAATSNPFFGLPENSIFDNVTTDKLPDVARDVFGLDVSKPGWLGQMLSDYKEYIGMKEEIPQFRESAMEYESVLTEAPQSIIGALKAWKDGKDYRPFLTDAIKTVTYEKEFSKLTDDEASRAVKELTGVDMSIDDLKKPENLGILNAARVAFDSKRAVIIKEAQDATDRAESIRSKTSDIAKSSLSELKSKYPGFSKNDIAKVENVMEKGLGTLFFDKNGLPHKNVAERVAYVLFGESLVQEAKNKGTSQGRTEAALEIASASRSRGFQAGSANNNNLTNEAQVVENLIKTLAPKKQTY